MLAAKVQRSGWSCHCSSLRRMGGLWWLNCQTSEEHKPQSKPFSSKYLNPFAQRKLHTFFATHGISRTCCFSFFLDHHFGTPLVLNLLRTSASLWRPKRSRSARGAQLGGSRCRRRRAPDAGQEVLFQHEASLGKGTLAFIAREC